MAPVLIKTKENKSQLSYEYFDKWHLYYLNRLGSMSVKTPTFSPLPDSDITFYFELWYQIQGLSYEAATSFRMILVKSREDNIPKNMKMHLTVEIIYLGDCIENRLFKMYDRPDVNVKNMYKITTFPNELIKHYVYDKYRKLNIANDHSVNSTVDSLAVKCHMKFYEHLESPAGYLREKRLLKNLKEFLSDFSCIYQPGLLTDIEIKVGDESIPAHKSILAAHSPVFRRMMCDDFLESKTNTIVIKDTSPEIFRCFLNYLYCGETQDKTLPTVKEVCILADKYDVRSLIRECGEILVSILSVENACEILKIAYDYGDEDFKKDTKNFAIKHIHEVSSRNDWKELIKSNACIVYDVMIHFAPKSD